MKTEDNNKIYELIGKSLTGAILPSEKAIMDEWLAKNRENQLEFEDIVDLWKKSKNFQFPGKIDTQGALRNVRRQAKITQNKQLKLTLLLQIAAILVLSILFSGLYSYFSRRHYPESAQVVEEVHAAFGTRTSVDLPDGTRVYLNSGSSLRFPTNFQKLDQRRVELQGEGYFKVAKNIEKPFIVKADKLEVEALGTEFNIDAYNADEKIEITLVEGKVGIGKVNGISTGHLMTLSPNQVAHFNLNENTIAKTEMDNLERIVGWVDGKLVFLDDPIQEVVRKMENWYHVAVVISDKRLLNYRFTGTFIDETVEEILAILALTSPMAYEIKPAEKLQDGRYSKREIILKSK